MIFITCLLLCKLNTYFIITNIQVFISTFNLVYNILKFFDYFVITENDKFYL